MKEITRIHIAKIAYDIEIDAKKELESYIRELEHYASDPEILSDIEIRITELLGEHGIAAGGVVTVSDVAAVRAQLGEPIDFSDGGAEAPDLDTKESRRVYRDEDEAMVGGVLAGLAKFFGVSALWVRVAFVVLLFLSFGTAIVVYLILWLLIPPASTAAEKLRMSGKPVTLASIKELSGGGERVNERALLVQQVLGGILGVMLVFLAIGGLLAVLAVFFGAHFGPIHRELTYLVDGELHTSWWFMTMMGLFVLSGVLFSVLCLILANAAFRRRWSKRVGIVVFAIITAGIVAFAGGVGTGMYGNTAVINRLEQLRDIVPTDLSEDFMNATALTINAETVVAGDISYEVSDKPYYVLDSLPGVEADIQLSSDGKTIDVTLKGSSDRMYSMMAPMLQIYGPALESIKLGNDSAVVSYYNKDKQDAFSIDARNTGERFSLSGEYTSVSVVSDAYSNVSLDSAAIGDLTIDGGGVQAGGVRSLNVTQPDVCPAHAYYQGGYSVTVVGVSEGKMIYNGKEVPAETISNSCGEVVIGDSFDQM